MHKQSFAGCKMEVTVIKMRNKGMIIPKSRLCFEMYRRGKLTINETSDNHLHRTIKTAHLSAIEGRTDCELLEPVLLWVNDGRFVLTGIEHSTTDGQQIDYVQSWLCLTTEQQLPSTDKELYDERNRKRWK